MDELDPYAEIDGAVAAYLADGPLPLRHVIDRLAADGLLDELIEDTADLDDEDVVEVVGEVLYDHDGVWLGPSERLARLDQLLHGRVLTHRLTEAELAAGWLDADPDLDLLGWARVGPVPLAAGGDLVAEFTPDDDLDDLEEASEDEGAGPPVPNHRWVGPEGWLDGFDAGALLAVRSTPDGVALSVVDQPVDDELERAALAVAVEHRIPPGRGEEGTPIVLDALVVDREAFTRPVRPIGELLTALGLERRGGEWGRAGGAWLTAGEAYRTDRRERLRVDWGFDACCQEAFDVVHEAWARSTLGPDLHPMGRDQAVAVLRDLAHGAVAPAFVEEVLGVRPVADPQLEAFATQLVDLGGRHAAPAHYLLALNAERDGASDVSAQQLEVAVRLDPAFAPAPGELAAYAVDRGDLDRAVRLYQQAGATADEPELEWLVEQRDRVAARYRGVTRNDPCPCGSGRKFKACCERNPRAPLADRVDLLVHKLAGFALRPHRRYRVEELADLVDRLSDGDEPPVGLDSLLDLVLFEGGIAEDYLRERWDLLPADEREVLESAVVTPRLLWEVVGVEEGRSLTLRGVAGGEEVTVIERAGSEGRPVGELLLGRVVRVGGVPVVLGVPVTVPAPLRASALELVAAGPDDEELLAWLCGAGDDAG